MRFRILISLALLLVLLQSCAQANSSGIDTSEFYGVFRAGLDEDGSYCRVYFTVGNGIGASFINLEDGDSVSCAANGESDTLDEESTLFNSVAYEGGAVLSLSQGDEVTFTLTRSSRSESFTATVTVPPPVASIAVVGSVIDRSESNAVTYTADSGDYISVEVGNWSGVDSNDDGSYTLEVSEEDTTMENGASTLRMTRNSEGEIDSGLDGRAYATNIGELSVTVQD